MFMWKNIKLCFTSNWRKIVVEDIQDFNWIGNSGNINSKSLRDFSRYVLIFKMDFMPFNVFLMLVVVSFTLFAFFCSLYIPYDTFLLIEDLLQLWMFLVSCF